MKLPLIFFAVILLLVVLTKWYKNRPVKESAPAKTDTSKKKKTFPFGTVITLLILAAIAWFGYRYFTDLPSRQQAPAVAQQEQLPICAGGEYDFSTAEIPGEIAVGFQAGCISQVTLPSRVVFRTDTSADVKIKFIDGSEYIDGPKKQVWYGLKRGVFKVRGLSEAGTMKITLEKSS